MIQGRWRYCTRVARAVPTHAAQSVAFGVECDDSNRQNDSRTDTSNLVSTRLEGATS